MTRTIINPAGLHEPVRFGYSHVVEAGGLVFVAGQYASDATGAVVPGDFATQVRVSLDNLEVALAGACLGLDDVAQIRTYVVEHDQDKLATVVALETERWGSRPPAQTLVGVASLALPGMLFEIEAVAVRGD